MFVYGITNKYVVSENNSLTVVIRLNLERDRRVVGQIGPEGGFVCDKNVALLAERSMQN
jgi:hypothetical protein